MVRMADIIDVTGLQREVERRAGDSKIRCNFSDKVQTAYIRGNIMYLPRLPCPFNMEDFLIIRMSYIHELAHWQNKTVHEVFAKYPKLDMNSNLGHVWNIIEDQLDERTAAMAFPGDRKALGEGGAVLLGRQLAWILDVTKKKGTPPLSEDDVKRLAVFCMANRCRDWDTFSGPIFTASMRILPTEATSLTHTLIDEGWVDKIIALTDAHEAIALAALLVKRLWPEENPEEQLERAKGKGEGKGEGEGDKSEEKKEGGEPEAGEGKPKEGIEEKLHVIPWEKLMFQKHDSENLSAHASRIDWTGKQSSGTGFVPASPDQFRIIKVFNT